MSTSPSTVGIAPGEGLVARFGAVVVYLAGETSSTERILGAIEAVADADHPGAAIAQRLAAVVFAGGSEPPPFGVLAPTSDGTVILLRGPVIAEIQGAEGVRRISGARAFTWVDEIVREPVRRIAIGTDTGAPLAVRARTDLRAGVVPGGGFEFRLGLRRSGKSTARPARSDAESAPDRRDADRTVIGTEEPAHTAPAGFEVLDDPEPVRAPSAERAAAAPPPPETLVADRTETGAASAPRTGMAKPAHPRRISETASDPVGTKAMPQTWSQTPASSHSLALHKGIPPDDSETRPARPPGPTTDGSSAPGSLVFNDTAYPLDRPYVIGRSPMTDEAVRNAVASPLAVPRDRHVSRIHAYITLERGKVFVRDAGTPAGTYIAAPGADSWTRLGSSITELAPGWSIRIGEKVLTYRADDNPRRPKLVK